ncbi:hypothetical protein Tco_0493614 [Tanacetum coccineum]
MSTGWDHSWQAIKGCLRALCQKTQRSNNFDPHDFKQKGSSQKSCFTSFEKISFLLDDIPLIIEISPHGSLRCLENVSHDVAPRPAPKRRNQLHRTSVQNGLFQSGAIRNWSLDHVMEDCHHTSLGRYLCIAEAKGHCGVAKVFRYGQWSFPSDGSLVGSATPYERRLLPDISNSLAIMTGNVLLPSKNAYSSGEACDKEMLCESSTRSGDSEKFP